MNPEVHLTVITRTYSVKYLNKDYLVISNFYTVEEERTWIVYENNEDLIEDIHIIDTIVDIVKGHHGIKGGGM